VEESNTKLKHTIVKITNDDGNVNFHGYLVFVTVPMGWHLKHEDKFSELIDLLAINYFFYCSCANVHGALEFKTTWIFKRDFNECFIHGELKKNRNLQKRIISLSKHS